MSDEVLMPGSAVQVDRKRSRIEEDVNAIDVTPDVAQECEIPAGDLEEESGHEEEGVDDERGFVTGSTCTSM